MWPPVIFSCPRIFFFLPSAVVSSCVRCFLLVITHSAGHLDCWSFGAESERSPWPLKTCFVLQRTSPAGWRAQHRPCTLHSPSKWKTLWKSIAEKALKSVLKSVCASSLNLWMMFGIPWGPKFKKYTLSPFYNCIFMYMCWAVLGCNSVLRLNFTSTEAVNEDGLLTPPFHWISPRQMTYDFPSTHYSWNFCEVKYGNSMQCSFELSSVFMDQNRWAFGEQNIMTLLLFSRGSYGLAIWFQGKGGVWDILIMTMW